MSMKKLALLILAIPFFGLAIAQTTSQKIAKDEECTFSFYQGELVKRGIINQDMCIGFNKDSATGADKGMSIILKGATFKLASYQNRTKIKDITKMQCVDGLKNKQDSRLGPSSQASDMKEAEWENVKLVKKFFNLYLKDYYKFLTESKDPNATKQIQVEAEGSADGVRAILKDFDMEIMENLPSQEEKDKFADLACNVSIETGADANSDAAKKAFSEYLTPLRNKYLSIARAKKVTDIFLGDMIGPQLDVANGKYFSFNPTLKENGGNVIEHKSVGLGGGETMCSGYCSWRRVGKINVVIPEYSKVLTKQEESTLKFPVNFNTYTPDMLVDLLEMGREEFLNDFITAMNTTLKSKESYKNLANYLAAMKSIDLNKKLVSESQGKNSFGEKYMKFRFFRELYSKSSAEIEAEATAKASQNKNDKEKPKTPEQIENELFARMSINKMGSRENMKVAANNFFRIAKGQINTGTPTIINYDTELIKDYLRLKFNIQKEEDFKKLNYPLAWLRIFFWISFEKIDTTNKIEPKIELRSDILQYADSRTEVSVKEYYSYTIDKLINKIFSTQAKEMDVFSNESLTLLQKLKDSHSILYKWAKLRDVTNTSVNTDEVNKIKNSEEYLSLKELFRCRSDDAPADSMRFKPHSSGSLSGCADQLLEKKFKKYYIDVANKNTLKREEFMKFYATTASSENSTTGSYFYNTLEKVVDETFTLPADGHSLNYYFIFGIKDLFKAYSKYVKSNLYISPSTLFEDNKLNQEATTNFLKQFYSFYKDDLKASPDEYSTENALAKESEEVLVFNKYFELLLNAIDTSEEKQETVAKLTKNSGGIVLVAKSWRTDFYNTEKPPTKSENIIISSHLDGSDSTIFDLIDMKKTFFKFFKSNYKSSAYDKAGERVDNMLTALPDKNYKKVYYSPYGISPIDVDKHWGFYHNACMTGIAFDNEYDKSKNGVGVDRFRYLARPTARTGFDNDSLRSTKYIVDYKNSTPDNIIVSKPKYINQEWADIDNAYEYGFEKSFWDGTINYKPFMFFRFKHPTAYVINNCLDCKCVKDILDMSESKGADALENLLVDKNQTQIVPFSFGYKWADIKLTDKRSKKVTSVYAPYRMDTLTFNEPKNLCVFTPMIPQVHYVGTGDAKPHVEIADVIEPREDIKTCPIKEVLESRDENNIENFPVKLTDEKLINELQNSCKLLLSQPVPMPESSCVDSSKNDLCYHFDQPTRDLYVKAGICASNSLCFMPNLNLGELNKERASVGLSAISCPPLTSSVKFDKIIGPQLNSSNKEEIYLCRMWGGASRECAVDADSAECKKQKEKK
jgi:hypothetical protein